MEEEQLIKTREIAGPTDNNSVIEHIAQTILTTYGPSKELTLPIQKEKVYQSLLEGKCYLLAFSPEGKTCGISSWRNHDPGKNDVLIRIALAEGHRSQKKWAALLDATIESAKRRCAECEPKYGLVKIPNNDYEMDALVKALKQKGFECFNKSLFYFYFMGKI